MLVVVAFLLFFGAALHSFRASIHLIGFSPLDDKRLARRPAPFNAKNAFWFEEALLLLLYFYLREADRSSIGKFFFLLRSSSAKE